MVGLLLRAVQALIASGKLVLKNQKIKKEIMEKVNWAILRIKELPFGWKLAEVLQFLNGILGFYTVYQIVMHFKEHAYDDLNPEMRAELDQEIANLESVLSADGIDPNSIPKLGEEEPAPKQIYTPPTGDWTHQKIEEKQPGTPGTGQMLADYMKNLQSYSGTDMVCSINVPGRGPIVFGELASISYSIFREKVPVRSLGRVSMKGYTRGMRTITGILAFTEFDESIVYKCMEDIKKAGYRMLMDEMPTFDITISMANEFGSKSRMTLYGVSTYTEGKSMSINEIVTQSVFEFYALDIDPMSRMYENRQTSELGPNGHRRIQ